VRVGSSLHAKLIEATQIDATKPPKASDFKCGDVYEAKNGDRAIFLGWVSTIEMTHEGSTSYSSYPQDHRVTLERVPRIQCWYGVGKSDNPLKELGEWRWWSVDLKKTSSFRKRLDPIKVPSQWAYHIRAEILRELHKTKGSEFSRGTIRPCDLSCYCARLHIAQSGETVPLHEEFAAYKHLLT
jgi:hypothetical protein